MVLADLGKKLQDSLRRLATEPVVDEKTIDAILKDICAALLESDVNVRLVQQLRANVKKQVLSEDDKNPAKHTVANKKRLIHKVLFNELCRLVDPQTAPWKPVRGNPNVLMLVGLQGAGKTTTATKLAYYYQRKGWKVALVCADTFRAGAFDQLKQNAAKAKIPFFGSYSESDPVAIALQGVIKFRKEGFDLIIVDTSGRHRQETELFAEMTLINKAVKPNNVTFVMDGTIGQAAESQAQAFKEAVDVGAIIMTKMDGHARGGGALSAVAATKSPIVFIGTGEHMYDLDVFDAHKFIGKLLGMGDVQGLIETVQDMTHDKQDMIERLQQGEFSLKDMRDQLTMIMGMGPLSKVMGMLPGLPASLTQMNDGEATTVMKRFMYMFDSMTMQELNSDGKLFEQQPTRIDRVAKGSGTHREEVSMLLQQCAQFAKMVKSMGSASKILKKSGDKKKMNPKQMAQLQSSLKSMVPQEMLNQVGGMGGLQQMMQQMMGGGQGGLANMLGGLGGAGGANPLANLAGMFGGGGMPGMPNMPGMPGMPPTRGRGGHRRR